MAPTGAGMRRQHAGPDHVVRRRPRRRRYQPRRRPSYTDGPIGLDMIMRNITLTGGVDPARHYIDGILPDVLEGHIEPGRVLDHTVGLDGVPDGYRAMAGRQSLKVLITP
jgi:hypothetical protein